MREARFNFCQLCGMDETRCGGKPIDIKRLVCCLFDRMLKTIGREI